MSTLLTPLSVLLLASRQPNRIQSQRVACRGASSLRKLLSVDAAASSALKSQACVQHFSQRPLYASVAFAFANKQNFHFPATNTKRCITLRTLRTPVQHVYKIPHSRFKKNDARCALNVRTQYDDAYIFRLPRGNALARA